MTVTRTERRRLEAIVADRSAPQKHVWRAHIILATAEGCGTADARGLAMAGAIHGRGCRRAHPRQDAQARQATRSWALPGKMISMPRISALPPSLQRSYHGRAAHRMGKLRQGNGQRLVMESVQSPPQGPSSEYSFRQAFGKALLRKWRG